MLAIGYSAGTAWIFPAIIDTAVAVSTLMLVALGDKPVRRVRIATMTSNTEVSRMRQCVDGLAQSANPQFEPVVARDGRKCVVDDSVQTDTSVADADLAAELIASRVTTQPIETVISVLAAYRGGASINAAARQAKINYRTAQRIVDAAEGRRRGDLQAAS
jgi:hypothetical protein